MAQHDYVIANGTGAAVRSDLNNALAAIVSQNSGATAPATTYAFQFWADTTTGLLKLRNSANSAWVTLFQLDGEWSTLPVENGTAAAPSIYFKDSGTDTGFYSPGTDQVAISTGGTGRLFINSSGSVGIGTSSPSTVLHISSASPTVRISDTSGTTSDLTGQILFQEMGTTSAMGRIGYTGGDAILRVKTDGAQPIAFLTNDAERVRITSGGNVGIGTTSPGANLEIKAASTPVVRLNQADTYYAPIKLAGNDLEIRGSSGTIEFYNGANDGDSSTEKMRIDGSGRLLVGTSTANGTNQLQIEGSLGSNISLRRGEAPGNITSGEFIGGIEFQDNAEHIFGIIECRADANAGTNDYPGRLVFSVTADGASSPTEAMRINNKGQVGINYSGTANGRGLFIQSSGTSSADYTIYTLNNAASQVHFGYRNDGFLRSEAIYIQTTASAANVFVDSNGFLYRSTSSERYKRDIVAAPYTLEQIDRLRAVNYKTSSPNADGEVSDQVFGGLIAEEVNEAGFEEFVVFDDQGRPDALQYGQMIAVAIKGLQEAHARIKELEAKVAALESA